MKIHDKIARGEFIELQFGFPKLKECLVGNTRLKFGNLSTSFLTNVRMITVPQ